ncbi:MAG: succinylglutamate desuccinylase/aspartoacylase family protein [Bryobacteraceae bacterium]|nr:succinylglutamate desuccinylase/aspartoacylase family protein [Bryobacteraceae bacterium]
MAPPPLLSFQPENFARGEKHRLRLAVDADESLPVLLARGATPGPVLVASAGVHGDEYEGVRAIFEVFDELDPLRMSGDLLAVPVVNAPAFWHSTRLSPVDGANLARVFPGKPAGTLSERLAHGFAQAIIARASLYLDLHSGGIAFGMPAMVGYAAQDPRGRAAAEAFGADVIWGHPHLDPGRTISFAASLNIPWLYTEARGAGRIHPDDLAMMKRGIVNLLHHLRVLPGPPTPAPIQHRLWGDGNTDAGVQAGQSGFLMKCVRVLQRVTAGQCLGRLVDLEGRVLEAYHAPANGLVGLARELPVVRAGDPLFLVVQEEGE